MGRTVRKLSNLEIDEVSLVDRPANQHGLVAIAKSYQEDNMAVFDANGDEVFEEELSNGDLVYDEQGNEYVFTDQDSDGEDDGDDGAEEVGKARGDGILLRGMYAGDKARGAAAYARYKAPEVKHAARRKAGQADRSARRALGADRATAFSRGKSRGQASAFSEGQSRTGRAFDRASGAAAGSYGAHPYSYAGGGAAVVGGGGLYANHRRKVNKSLGDEVLSELSKALTEDDRDAVIAKALDRVGEIAERNAELEETVASLIDERQLEGFGQIAKSYQLGVDDQELAGVLYRAAQVLDEDDLDVLDRVFTGAGQISKAYFDEIGAPGFADGGALEEVYAVAGNAVVKGAELGLTEEQAVTAVFDTNPAAYDMYEAEQRMR